MWQIAFSSLLPHIWGLSDVKREREKEREREREKEREAVKLETEGRKEADLLEVF
jgi:hypothetical protein